MQTIHCRYLYMNMAMILAVTKISKSDSELERRLNFVLYFIGEYLFFVLRKNWKI